MGSLNRVTLLGNLGQDPEVRATTKGASVTNLRVATNDGYTDKDGQRQEQTEWHRVVVWGKAAEASAKFLKKGSSVLIEGRLQTRSYKRDGVDVYTTEVVASNVQFLSSARGKAPNSGATDAAGEGALADGDDVPPPSAPVEF